MKSQKSRRILFASTCVGFVGILGSAGCAHKQTIVSPSEPPVAQGAAKTQPPALVAAQPSRTLHVSDEILGACKIDFNNVDRAPKFDFDRSDLSPQDRSVLQQIAQCVTTGPLKGRSLRLIGRADPRGETEYNMVLGQSRATSVDHYLDTLGVNPNKVSATSRGELDATGKDEPSWQRDRRVDVLLI